MKGHGARQRRWKYHALVNSSSPFSSRRRRGEEDEQLRIHEARKSVDKQVGTETHFLDGTTICPHFVHAKLLICQKKEAKNVLVHFFFLE